MGILMQFYVPLRENSNIICVPPNGFYSRSVHDNNIKFRDSRL